MSAFGNSPLVLGGNSLSVASGTSPVGTLGITDDQVAVGAAVANTIEGSANFTFGLANGLRLSSSVTGGAQLYNTADQTTNYERLEWLWSSNIGIFRAIPAGTGTARDLRLMSSNAGAAGNSTIILSQSNPRVNLGVYNSATGTTNVSTSTTGTFFSLGNITSTATSGSIVNTSITPTYNQASGTAANTDLLINRTETAVGSGAQYIILGQVGGADRAGLTNLGYWRLSAGTGTAPAFSFLADTDTGIFNEGANILSFATTGQIRSNFDASGSFMVGRNPSNRSAWGTVGAVLKTSSGETYTDSSTAGSGTAATATFASFAIPTLAASNASVTTTDAATVYIAGAPAAGANMTITRGHALWIDAGSFRLDGTDGAGVGAGTLANAPSAGDPDKWIPINSDGTQYWIPAWAA